MATTLIPAARRRTRVDWDELRAVAQQVQADLDAHGAAAHDEYAYVSRKNCTNPL